MLAQESPQVFDHRARQTKHSHLEGQRTSTLTQGYVWRWEIAGLPM